MIAVYVFQAGGICVDVSRFDSKRAAIRYVRNVAECGMTAYAVPLPSA